MKISQIQSYNHNNKYKQNNNVSFEGFNLKAIYKNTAKQAEKDERIHYLCSKISDTLGIKTSEIFTLTKGTSERRMDFFRALADNYNIRNFALNGKLKEDIIPVIDTFKLIEKPQKIHFSIVDKINAPFETILELFKNAPDKNSLEFIQKIQHDVLDNSRTSADLIINMLASKNKNEYIHNIWKYSSYLKLNKDKKDAIKTLDKLIEGKKYNQNEFDTKYAISSFYKRQYVQTLFPNKIEYFEKNYTKEGIKFLKSFIYNYLPYNKQLSPDDINELLKIYKTTNPKNIESRIELINKLASTTKEIDNAEIKSIKKLFQRIDEDKNGMNFIHKILEDDIPINSAKVLNDVLDIIPSKKAEIFHKNIANILKYTNEEERIAALKKEVENPFFITKRHAKQLEESIYYGFAQKESKFSKYIKIFENNINKIKYSIAKVSKKENITNNLPVITDNHTLNSSISQVSPKLELKRRFKESPQARKLRIKNEVNEIIKEKLGQKTLERQKEEYTTGAMVMRLKLLPEIFESIKDTRRLRKASGQRPNVESKDAIRLYSKINGKNRKLVNYMLKQRDSISGNRIYDIKDIIKRLKLVENKIATSKETKGKDFHAKDAKEIWNNEYETIIAQYGKLKRKKKTA